MIIRLNSQNETVQTYEGTTENAIQLAINDAKDNDTIYCKDTIFTITSNKNIILKSNIILKASNCTIKGNATSGGLANSNTSNGWITGNTIKNVEISGFTFISDAKLSDGGHGESRNVFMLRNCTNIIIHDNQCLKYMYNDFAKIHSSNNIKIYNNVIQSGHDGIEFLSNCTDCEAYNNDMEIRINCGIRIDNGKRIKLHHNLITGQQGTGWCIFELEDSVTDCEIYNNIAHDWTGSSGNAFTQDVHATISNVQVHDNILIKVGSIKVGNSYNNSINPKEQDINKLIKKGYGPQNKIVSAVKPTAKIGASTIQGTVPLIVTFVNMSVNADACLWDFGSGVTSDKNEVSYTFDKVGTYTVKLTATNDSGSNTTTQKITVISQPESNIVIVSFDGKGKFNCTGTKSNPIDSIIINQALQYAYDNKMPTVILNGTHSYYISDYILKFDGIELIGTKGAQIIWDLPYNSK